MNVIVVTGASSGIGREFAEALGNAGWADELWVIARRADRLEELQSGIGIRVVPISLDLSLSASVEQYRRRLADSGASVLALVNAAGFGRFGEVENLLMSEQMDMIDLNCSALTAMTYVTLPYMAEGGEIYQLASLSAWMPLPYISVYAATKAYVLSFSRSLNVELRARGIRSMAVCPTWVRTEFIDRAAEQNDVIVHYGQIFTPRQVVRRALRDMRKGKDVSVCGALTRWKTRGMKLLPHRLLLRLWCRMQKK